MTTRARIGIGVALGLGALALGGIWYRAVDRQRRQRDKRELDQRVDTWEGEGGAAWPLATAAGGLDGDRAAAQRSNRNPA